MYGCVCDCDHMVRKTIPRVYIIPHDDIRNELVQLQLKLTRTFAFSSEVREAIHLLFCWEHLFSETTRCSCWQRQTEAAF